jgi:hypothetical protein
MRFVCAPLFAFLIGSPAELASAGEFDRSTLPAATADPAPCDSHSVGPGVLKDSGDCRRISGYIAAGAQFGSDEQGRGRSSRFGPLDATEFVGSVREGQDRFFLSPGPGDEAR